MIKSAPHLLCLTALVTVLQLAALQPAAAQTGMQDNQNSGTVDMPSDAAPQPAPHAMSRDSSDSAMPRAGSIPHHDGAYGQMQVEQRIKTLHDKLKITSAQEEEWQKVATTMRDNEESIGQLIKDRHQNGATMTALDDIKSYQQITQAHADGMQKMLAAFEPLYSSMSDDQKKNADMVFGHFEGRHKGHDGKKSHS